MNPAIQHLIDQLHHVDPEARGRAAAALGQFGVLNEDTTGLNTHGVAALIGALDDPDAYVRREVAYALGALGEASAIPALLAAYDQMPDDGGLRLVIIKGLGKIAHPDAAPRLRSVLRDAPSICLRTAAAKALARIPAPEASQGKEG